MSTWSPLFAKIVESSLWSESDLVCKIFITLLAKKDCNQTVQASAYTIGQWAHKSEAEALQALKILSEPDRHRIEPQPYEGRRIQKIAGGWLILNGQMYEDLMRKISRRIYKAKKEREYRAMKRGGPLPGEVQAVKDFGDGVVDKNFQPTENQ